MATNKHHKGAMVAMGSGRTSTGVAKLDEILDGGLRNGAVTAVAGKAGTGKSIALLTCAIKSQVDTVVYAPELAYDEIKGKIAILCEGLGVDVRDVTYDVTNGLWLVVKLPTHYIRIAGRMAKASATSVSILNNAESMIAAGVARMVIVDSFGHDVKKSVSAKAVKRLAELAYEGNVPVLVSVRLKRATKDEAKDTLKEVAPVLMNVSKTVIWVAGWPKVSNGATRVHVAVLDDDDADDEWETKDCTFSIKQTRGLGSKPVIGFYSETPEGEVPAID